MPVETLRPASLGAYSDWDGAPPPSANLLADPNTFSWPTDDPWRAANNNVSPEVIIVFDPPSDTLTVGADLQTFRCQARPYSSTQSGSPTCRIELWENIIGSGWTLVRAGPELTFAGTASEIKTFTWDVGETAYQTSGRIGFKFIGIKSGGSPGARNTTDLAAVEWDATINDPVIFGDVTFSAEATLTAEAEPPYKATLSGVATLTADATKIRGGEWFPTASATLTPDGTVIIPPRSTLSGVASITATPPLDRVLAVGKIPDQGHVLPEDAWEARTTPTTNRAVYGIDYSPQQGKFVYTADYGILASSTDGITWTSEAGITSTHYNIRWCNHFANPNWVVTGPSGKLQINPTATGTWTNVTPFGTGVSCGRIGFDGKYTIIVACGTGWIARSSDGGERFTAILPSGGSNSYFNYDAVYSPDLDLWVVFAANSTSYTSTDGGLTWTQRTIPLGLGGNAVRAGIWLVDQFIAVADDNQLCFSPDGINWTVDDTLSPLAPLADLLGITYSEEYDMLQVHDIADVIYSTDKGVSWSQDDSHNFILGSRCQAYGNNVWVLAGGTATTTTELDSAVLRPTQDHVKLIANGTAEYTGTLIGGKQTVYGTEWVETDKAEAVNWTVVRYGNGYWLSRYSTSGASNYLKSTDGVNWSAVGSINWTTAVDTIPAFGGGLDYDPDNGYWLQIGKDAFNNPMLWQSANDGVTWTELTPTGLPGGGQDNSLVYVNGYWILSAGQNDGFIYYSAGTDRVTWTGVDVGMPNEVLYVRHIGGNWVAVSNTYYTSYSSTLGSGWSTGFFTNDPYGTNSRAFVTDDAGTFGMVLYFRDTTTGRSPIWTTTDGITWTEATIDTDVYPEFISRDGTTWIWDRLTYSNLTKTWWLAGFDGTTFDRYAATARSQNNGETWELIPVLESTRESEPRGYVQDIQAGELSNQKACVFTELGGSWPTYPDKWGYIDNTVWGNGANLEVYGTRILPSTTRLNTAGSITANATVTLPNKVTFSVASSLSSKLTKQYQPIDLNENISILPAGVKLLYTGKHHGPFISSKGELYVWAYDSNNTQLRAYKAQDRDSAWSYVTGSGINWDLTRRYTLYQGPAGTDYEDKVYLAWQIDDVFAYVKFSEFDIFYDNMTVGESFIKSTYNSSSGRGALYPCVSMTHRYVSGVYQVVVVYNGYPTYSGGNTYERVDMATRVPGSAWVTDISVDPGNYANSWVMNTIATDRNNDGYIHVWHSEDDGDVNSPTYWATIKDTNVKDPATSHVVGNWHKLPLLPGEFEPMGFCTALKQITSQYTVRALFSYTNTTTYRTGNVFHTETDVNDVVENGVTDGISKLISDDLSTEEPDHHWNAFTQCTWDGDKAPGTDEEEHYVTWIAKNTDKILTTKDIAGTGYQVSTTHRTLVAPDDYAMTGARIPIGLHDVFAFLYNESGTVHWDELRLSSYVEANKVISVGNGYVTSLSGTRILTGALVDPIAGEATVTSLTGTKLRADVESGALDLSSDTTVTPTGQIVYRSALVDLSADTTVNVSTSMPVTGTLTAVGSADAVYWQGVLSASVTQQPVPVEIFAVRGDGEKEGDPIVDPLLTSDAVAVSRGRAELDRQYLPTKTYEVDVLYRNDLRLGQLLEVHDLLFNETWYGKLLGIAHKIGTVATQLGTWTSLSVERHVEYVQPVYKQFIVSTFPAQLSVVKPKAILFHPISVDTTPDSLIATPYAADIAIGTAKNINATPATLNVTEQQATFNIATNVISTPKALNVTVPSATIIPELESRIDTTPKAVTLTGIQAVIGSSTAVETTPVTVTVTGAQAAISIPENIDSTPAAITVTEQQASISLGKSVATTPASISVTKQQATLKTDVNITTTPASKTVTEAQATILEGSGAVVNATPVALSVTEQQATIDVRKEVSTTPATITVTKQQATVKSDVNVASTPVTLTVTTHNATIFIPGDTEVTTTPATVQFFTVTQSEISRIIEWEINTTPANIVATGQKAIAAWNVVFEVSTTPAAARWVQVDATINRD